MRYLPCCEMYHPSGDLSFVPEGLYLPIFLSWSGQARCLYPIIFYFTFTVGRFLLAYILIYLKTTGNLRCSGKHVHGAY